MHIEKLSLSVIVSTFDELSAEEQQLVMAALEACKTSYAPFSRFNVGAALLMASGETVCGSNQENVAFPSGLCAERTAMYYANAHYPEIPILAMAITSSVDGIQNRTPVYPCGSCRQSLLQCETRFCNDIKILMAGSDSVAIVVGVKNLLPLGFDNFQ